MSDDGIIRKQPEQFEEADRDNIKQTTLNYVVQKLEKAGIEVIADKEEFHRILEVKNHLQKMTENITGNGEEIHKINEVTRDILIKALEETAIPLTEVIYSRDNYNKIFGKGIIQSPVEEIKMGANQFIRLCPPDRNNLIAAVYETLTAPSLVLEKETYDEKTESFKPIHVYGKSFITPTNNHKRAVESIIIFKEDENIAVSLHNKGIGEFVKQIKTADEIIYMDNNISRVATLELVRYKNGGSHVVKESQNLLSSAGQKSLPFD